MGLFKKDIEEELEEKVESNGKFITPLEMKDFELLEARALIQSSVLDKLKLSEQIMKMEHAQQMAVLRTKIRETANSLQNCKEEYNKYRQSVASRLDINFDNYTILENGELKLIEVEDFTEE